MNWLSDMQIHVLALPMRAPFRGITVREAVLLQGSAGWGEFAPFVEYDDREASTWLAAAREAATRGWPEPVREQVPVNVTVPALAAQAAFELVRGAGCSTAKVKVAERGQSLADDIERVAAVRSALGPDGRIRVDANARWSVEAAVAAIRELDAAAGGLEYVEQPCAGLDELAACRRRVEVPIAADESIRKAEDPMRVVVADAADIAVIKVAPLGGVHRAMQVAEACGLPCVVSSAIDTSVGLSAGIALAAALPQLPFACGLGTASMFPTDVSAVPLRAVEGSVPVRRVEPDADLLAALAAPPDRDRWWRDRLARCAALLP